MNPSIPAAPSFPIKERIRHMAIAHTMKIIINLPFNPYLLYMNSMLSIKAQIPIANRII
jgi:hypothetical protein